MADRALYQKGKATWDGYLKKPHHLDLSGIKVPKGVYSMTFWKEHRDERWGHERMFGAFMILTRGDPMKIQNKSQKKYARFFLFRSLVNF